MKTDRIDRDVIARKIRVAARAGCFLGHADAEDRDALLAPA
jgi:hypothetical protein